MYALWSWDHKMNQACKLPSVVYLDWIEAQVREFETDGYFLTGNRKKKTLRRRYLGWNLMDLWDWIWIYVNRRTFLESQAVFRKGTKAANLSSDCKKRFNRKWD